MLYTSNEVDQVLQVVERLSQRLFDIEDRALDEAPTPLPPSNYTDQRLQYRAIYGIGPLDWLKRRAYTKSA